MCLTETNLVSSYFHIIEWVIPVDGSSESVISCITPNSFYLKHSPEGGRLSCQDDFVSANLAVTCFDGNIAQSSIIALVRKAVLQGVIADCMMILSVPSFLKYTVSRWNVKRQHKDARQDH